MNNNYDGFETIIKINNLYYQIDIDKEQILVWVSKNKYNWRHILTIEISNKEILCVREVSHIDGVMSIEELKHLSLRYLKNIIFS